MDWFEKLNDYFPDHELKDPDQLQSLLQSSPYYHKEETEEYLILYAEFSTFIFIDYLLVTGKKRGAGIGSKLLERFKKKGKMIILEAEPVDADDPATAKRMNFYKKNGFQKADRIRYTREDDSGEEFQMNILYWPAEDTDQEMIMDKMRKACREIHNFHAHRFYGRKLADPDEALEWKH
ncbi:GNAT family N-acetyltransferase [Paenibacillus sp. J5C_2022]|uniref:GNAT family N-acetyltransferase n=1 Tax=Paenibacillus sp. J5C2022 TaxID=2977129 RepID=UPI0021D1CAB3|nr:GNAT family N-acetyltransferase [Paenibacillus sp. J5C2022]MCU6710564.1 GNAT family N-acetyltransferase [Paenibacillus sp. J5C2022]